VTGAIVLILLIGVFVVGYAVFHRTKSSKFLAVTEYWIYIKGDALPGQDKILDRMVAKNPYAQRGRLPIGPAEGIILSDVRLHIALMLRSKNVHIFRPDILENVEFTQEQLAEIADSNAIVKVRFVSEEPLKDKRHIQFLVHAADAVADLSGSKLIYDCIQRRLFSKGELEAALKQNPDATRAGLNVRTEWHETFEHCWAETYGLRKLGLTELKSSPMERDEKVLVLQLMDEAVEQLWSAGEMEPELEVEAFDDSFHIYFGEPEQGHTPTRIMRVQAT
jgi:hypothetical protein